MMGCLAGVLKQSSCAKDDMTKVDDRPFFPLPWCRLRDGSRIKRSSTTFVSRPLQRGDDLNPAPTTSDIFPRLREHRTEQRASDEGHRSPRIFYVPFNASIIKTNRKSDNLYKLTVAVLALGNQRMSYHTSCGFAFIRTIHSPGIRRRQCLVSSLPCLARTRSNRHCSTITCVCVPRPNAT